MNEYHEQFEQLQEQNSFKGQQWFGKRQELVEQYSWAVPNEDALVYLSGFEHLVEVGAGNGYWAKCIEDRGGSVRATDALPSDETWADVEQVSAESLDVRGEAVLLVWPPVNNPMAANVAKQGPDHIVYIGEAAGGCTADTGFFKELNERYGLVAKIDIPSYECVHDSLFHHVRKR